MRFLTIPRSLFRREPAPATIGEVPPPAPVAIAPTLRPPAPPRGRAGRKLRRFAAQQARSRYRGAPEGEPHAAHMLQTLGSQLSRTFRNDEPRRAARRAFETATDRLATATTALGTTTEQGQQRIAAGAGSSGLANNEPERARWTDAQQARAAIAQAQQALEAARIAQVEADSTLAAAEARAVDRLIEQAAAGLVPVNAYLAAFDRARADAGRHQLGLLGEEMVHTLVRAAVRPFDPHAPADEA